MQEAITALQSQHYDPNATNTNSTPVTTATIPYFKGTSETIYIARILQPYNICVAHKPILNVLILMNVKNKDESSDRQGGVYMMKCCDCQATYIEETGKNLNILLTEHKRATRNGDINNHIAEYHPQTSLRIDWDSVKCVIYRTDYFLSSNPSINESSWLTTLDQTPLNLCQQLPAPYKRLIDDNNRIDKQ